MRDQPEPESAAEVSCPWCGEAVLLTLDPWGGAVQDYVEDCEICCRPWAIHVQWSRKGRARVEVEPLGQ